MRVGAILLGSFLFYMSLSPVFGEYGKIYIFGSGGYSGIDILVIDPLNRKIGYDFNRKLICNDVEGTNYSSVNLSDFESETPGPRTVEIEIHKAIRGEYKFNLFSPDSVVCGVDIRLIDSSGSKESVMDFSGYISSGSARNLNFYFDPTPGAPPPTLTKVITFQTLRDDLKVALKLNQIGDEKFVKSLIKMVDISEKISNKCGELKEKNKVNCYRPVIAILRMVVKRLEVANKLCDNAEECKSKCKQKEDCDEEKSWKDFDDKYRKDKDFKEFFEEWDKDEWHKHKKECKRFVTDEALEIISGDVNWYVKSLGGDVWQVYKKEHNPYIHIKHKEWFK